MKYSREYILRRAFDVFMNKGYDNTSITVLQTELNMSRGAMYRYFKNKEELFICVVDEYFFNAFEKVLQNIDEKLTAYQFIELMHRRHRLIAHIFTRAGVTHTTFLNYTALLIQAAKYYPNFTHRFKEINKCMISNWRRALQNSINAKEIRSDIDLDIMSVIFNKIGNKESSDQEDCNDLDFAINVLQSVERKRQVLNYLYSLIAI